MVVGLRVSLSFPTHRKNIIYATMNIRIKNLFNTQNIVKID